MSYHNTTSNQEKSWLKNVAWSGNRITVSGKHSWIFLIVFGVVWSVVSDYGIFEIPSALSDDWLKGVVLIAFCSLGYIVMAYGLYSFFAQLKFRKSYITLDPFPGSLNGDVGGYLQLNIPFGRLRGQFIPLILSCRSKHQRREGGKTNISYSCLYQLQGVADIRVSSEGGTRLYFRFDLEGAPENLPESQLPADSYCYWEISAEIALPGINFNHAFEVPVYRCNKKSESDAVKRIDSAQVPVAKFEQNPASDSHSTIIKKTATGIEVLSPPAKKNANDTAFIVVGVVFFIVGVTAGIYGAPFIFALLFTLIGAGCLSTGVYNLFSSLRVSISYSGITVKSSFLKYQLSKKSFSKRLVLNIELAVNNHQEHDLSYKVVAEYLEDGKNKKIVLAKNIRNIKIGKSILSKLNSAIGKN